MDLDTLIIAVFCRMDDTLKAVLQGKRLRQRGPAPVLSDSEVLTMEAVGEYLGLSEDTALYRYFRQHYGHFFPGLDGFIEPLSYARQPTSGRLRSGFGSNSWAPSDMTLPLLWWTASLCRSVSLPGLTAASGSGERRPSGKTF